MSGDPFTAYEAKWVSAAEKQGHKLRLDEDGNVDWFASSGDYCNGPACDECSDSWCMHCTKPDAISPCDGGAAHAEYIAKRDRAEWARLLAEYGSDGPPTQSPLVDPIAANPGDEAQP